MKTIREHFAAINQSESELSIAVMEILLDLPVKDAQSKCANEIATMMLDKLNEINDLRKKIVKQYGF